MNSKIEQLIQELHLKVHSINIPSNIQLINKFDLSQCIYRLTVRCGRTDRTGGTSALTFPLALVSSSLPDKRCSAETILTPRPGALCACSTAVFRPTRRGPQSRRRGQNALRSHRRRSPHTTQRLPCV